jgi:membrane protease YdiL (CAAX protease family)
MAEAVSTNQTLFSRWAHRAPIAVFLTGTFLWAWLLWGYWLPTMPETGLVISPAFVITAVLGGFAPSLAAIGTSWLLGGRDAVRHLLHGLTRWRATPVQYALSIGLAPAAALLTTTLLPIFIGPLKPVDPAVASMAAIWPIMAALGEELGWRGFLFPRLLQRYGLVGSAVIVGVIWGVWHLPADFVGLKGYGPWWFWLAFLLNGPIVLTAHALIMAWLWRRSGANLLLMVIYHWSVTASAMLLPTAGSYDGTGLAATAVADGVLWIIAVGLWLWELQRWHLKHDRDHETGGAK